MPELPEVEAARAAIAEHCLGKKIVRSIIADDPKVIDGVSPRDFEESLNGKTIVAAHRKGKNMWLELDSPPFPTFQFGMSGAVYIKGVAVTKYKRSAVKDNDEWPSKYSKFFVELDDGLEFSFTDKRRFAKVRLLEKPVAVPPISDLGPDAYLEPPSVDEFHGWLSRKSTGIKALLLDQGFISGIGNWVADEVLYQARIHPLQSASSLSKEICGTLINCVNEVIGKAVEVGADCSQFPINWIFHSREKSDKAFVDGKKVDFIVAGGRTTAYVPEMQKFSGDRATKEELQKDSSKRSRSKKNGGRNNDSEKAEEEDLKGKAGKKTTNRKNASVKGIPNGNVNVGANANEGGSDSGYSDKEPKRTAGKKPSAGNKPEQTDETDDESEVKKTTSKKVSRKRKPLQSGYSAGDNYENKNTGDEKKAKKTMENNERNKNVESLQNRRSTRKKSSG